MKKFYWLLCVAAVSVSAVSCNTKLEDEIDYSFPVEITTKGENPVSMDIYDVKLITNVVEPDPELAKELANTDFFSLNASMIPGKRTGFMSDESILMMAYFPDLETLQIGQEIVPVRLSFGYFSSSGSGHVRSKYTSGKIVYRGRQGDTALFEFQDVLFITAPNTYARNGEHLIRGTMECPVYDNWNWQ